MARSGHPLLNEGVIGSDLGLAGLFSPAEYSSWFSVDQLCAWVASEIARIDKNLQRSSSLFRVLVLC